MLQIEEQREWNKTGGGQGLEEDDNPLDKMAVYQQILDILKPGETLVKVCILNRVIIGHMQYRS